MKSPYRLVPAVGTDLSDVLRTFDGQTAAVGHDPEACRAALVKGARPQLAGRSSYEAPPSAQANCLALEAAAREGQRVGFSTLAELLTEPSVRVRQQMQEHVANDLAPDFEAAPAPGLTRQISRQPALTPRRQ